MPLPVGSTVLLIQRLKYSLHQRHWPLYHFITASHCVCHSHTNTRCPDIAGLYRSGVLWSPSNVQPGWEDSAAVPTGASGLSGEETCYWNYGVNCTVSPPSVTGNLLWTLHVVRQSGRYQGNATVDTEVVFPLLDRAIQFYTHFMVSWTTQQCAVCCYASSTAEFRRLFRNIVHFVFSLLDRAV
jgi:hypothetical protein